MRPSRVLTPVLRVARVPASIASGVMSLVMPYIIGDSRVIFL